MPNAFNPAIAKSYDAIFQHAGVDVLYERGVDSVELTAAVGKSSFVLQDSSSGMVTDVEIRDYLLRAADLVIGGIVVEPQAGDFISEIDTGATMSARYVVVSPDRREPCWRWSDPARTIRRIHVKLVEEEAVVTP